MYFLIETSVSLRGRWQCHRPFFIYDGLLMENSCVRSLPSATATYAIIHAYGILRWVSYSNTTSWNLWLWCPHMAAPLIWAVFSVFHWTGKSFLYLKKTIYGLHIRAGDLSPRDKGARRWFCKKIGSHINLCQYQIN